jgi:PAS domain S-box-containing protein
MKSPREMVLSFLHIIRPLTPSGSGRPRIRFREAVAYILTSTLVVVTVGGFLRWHIASLHEQEMTSWRARQSSAAYDQAQRVSDWLKEREGDAQVLSASPAVRSVLQAYSEAGAFPQHPSGGPPGSLAVLDEMAKRYSYAGVHILDRDARVVMASSRSIPLNPSFSEACRAAAYAGVARTELVGDTPTRTLVGFIAPVFPSPAAAEAGQRPGQPLGIALLVSDASQTLFPLVMRDVVPTRTGETHLVRREGNAVVCFSPLRHVPAGSPHLRLPLSTAPLGARLALQGRETFLECNDYRGVPVLTATGHIPLTGWGLVRKIDRAEALEDFHRTAIAEGLAGALLIILLLGGVWMFHRREVLTQVLKQEEEKFRALLESAPDAMVVLNRTGHMALVNSATERIFGYEQGELLGQTFLNLVPERFREERAEYCARLFSSRALPDHKLQREWWGLRKDGSEFPAEVTFSAIETRSGTVMAIALRDVTERKRAEEALRDSERQYRTLFESANDAILIFEPENEIILEANQKACETYGFCKEELIGMSLKKLTKDVPRGEQQIAEILRHGSYLNFETVHINQDGSPIDMLASSSVIDHGGQRAILTILRDVSERKRTEEALQESEERFRSLVENATVGIYRTTPDGHILMANPALVRMLGFDSFEELAARNLECEGFESSYPRSVFRERIEREGQVIGLESAWTRRDGSVVFVRESARPVRADDGRVLHYDGIVEDITTRRQAEESMRQLSGRLLRLQDEERRHIARELHETAAQSLAGLAINLNMVRDSAPHLNPRASACLAESLELAEQCSREIRTLCYLLHPPLVDEAGLAPALRWYTAGFAQRSGIEVHAEVSPEFGRLPSDLELTLYRIVQEALTNIHLHSGSKTARICLERRPKEIVLTVADEGHGFPSAALGIAGPESADIGVGIPGMQERLRQLGGRLHIQTGRRGTTLTAYLPLGEVAHGETTHPTGG